MVTTRSWARWPSSGIASPRRAVDPKAQIGDENVHRVRTVMDEVFGDDNFISQISVKKTSGATGENLAGTTDYVLFYAKSRVSLKYRQLYFQRKLGDDGDLTYTFHQDSLGQMRRLKPRELNDIGTSDESKKVFRFQTLASQSLGEIRGRAQRVGFR